MKKSTISKFFDGIRNKISCCLVWKRIVSESNSLEFEERNINDFLTRVLAYCWRKSLVYYSTLLLLGLGFTANTYGQLVGGAAVKANFGIDADAYANLLQFGNLGGPSDTDDWFNSTYPGNGLGVIKQTDPIPTTPNESFSFRQSITTPTAPYPYPIVDGYLWIDAVYGRDNYVKGGSAEKSYFGGSGDKNSDNPSTWTIASGGSVPAKDDIVDVYAHLRGEGPKLPTLSDPRPFTTLWAYAAASVAVTNGNKHVDFEFFRTALETPADLNDPAKTGPDGGRTAFTFNADGSVAIPGTIIISIDYTNGGTSPQVRIRVWMDETVFNNYDNNAPLRPFTLDKNTAFEKGTDSGTFGYAAILENVGAVQNIFGRVNDNASTLGPPWGTFEGVGPSAVTDYQPLQFVEIGINLTAFGLDKRGTQDPCSNILGSLLVKTRSSGGGPNEGAFGSELKDFAGPYLFGNTGTPPTVTVPNKVVCENLATGSATVDLTFGATTTPAGGTIQYFSNSDYTGEITSPTTYSAAIGTTTIYTRTESQTNPGCFGYGMFDVTVNANPTANAGPDETKCQTAPSGPTSFTLAGTAANGTSVWSVFASTGTAAATINNTGSLTSTVSVAGIGTVTLRLTTTSDATPSCGDATDDVVLTVNANPTANAGQDQLKCQTAPSGPTSFTLAGSAANGTSVWSVFASTGTAVATINSAGSLTSTVSVAGIGTVTLRLTTTSDTTPSCGTATDDVVLTVNPNPTAAAGPDQVKCQTKPSGPTSFTLAGTATNGTAAWSVFASTGSAVATINSTGSLTSTVSVAGMGTVTLRLTTTSNTTPSCGTATDDVVLTVNANPTANAGPDQTLCQTPPSGPTIFTLAGSASNGTAVWSIFASTGTAVATINNPGSLTSTVSVAGIGTVTLRLTTTSDATPSCGIAADDDVLLVNANPTVNAGPDETKCQTAPSGPTSFTLAGTAANGTAVWSVFGSTGTAVATINNTGSLASTVSVAGIGTVTLRLTNTSNATPSCGTATDDVVLTVNANPTVNAGPDEIKCQTAPSGPTSFTLAGTAANGTPTWSVFASTGTAVATINNTGSLTSTVSVAGIGTVTLRLTNTSNATPSCGTVTDDVILTVNANPTANAGPDQAKCQTAPSGPTAFTLAGTAANGTSVWSVFASTGTAVATINSTSSLTSTVSVAGIGTVTLRLTTTSNTTPSCGTATDDVVLTVNPLPICAITGNQTICAGDSSTFTATAGMTTYAWTGPAGFTAATQAITVSVAGTYNVTITNSYGCISSCSRELTVESCAAALCTYTQGAYGNAGGKYCDGTVGGIATTDLIAQALTNAGGSITIGKLGKSVIMNSGDEACIINVMPGGGKASELPAGDIGICSLTTPTYLKNGKINNVLLSQTIALALNVNITSPSDLGGLILQAGTLATAKPAGGCGTDIPKVRVCGYYDNDTWIETVNEYTYRTFSAAVINAIKADGNGKKTVAGLLDLANRALANVDGIKNMEDGVSLSEIAGAVGSINEVFDECAIFMGWDIPECSPEPVDYSTTSKIELAGFTASPVPFKDQLTIKYDFDYQSDVKIEVFNAQGNRVLSKADTNSYLGKEVKLNLDVNRGQEQVYVVKLTTNRGSSTKKIMSSE